ncbi:hypothetical protein HPP92_012028 [Vanilla planifolia]|uniref:pyruvate decarboxylase n=1 Tax=Vanilla planifolia TaxID=51239 RepID=A0A835R443_VANPL|nr:hypothetical protein HPP92_012028 [Vanilla planifolia]
MGPQKINRSSFLCPDAGNGVVGGAPAAPCHPLAPAAPTGEATLGRHLARRLVQIGVRDVFTVPGDFNLTLLDHLIAEPGLNNIGCCNELNAGYASDGYARSNGVGACVVTFTVGGLSVLNAIAGAYSENLPMGLECAVEATAAFLNKAVKPVLVGGPKLRVAKAGKAFTELADACGYPVAVMPSAKGLVPENIPRFIGTYWGAVSTAFCAEIVESADAYLFAGPIFNDYSSVGYSLLLKKEKAIIVQPDRVVVGNGPAFGCILMKDFLQALAKRLNKNTTAHENYCRIFVPDGHPSSASPMNLSA